MCAPFPHTKIGHSGNIYELQAEVKDNHGVSSLFPLIKALKKMVINSTLYILLTTPCGKFGLLYSSRKSSTTQSYKCMLGLLVFSVIATELLTWTTGYLMIMCVYTGGWEHRQRVSTTFLTVKSLLVFLGLVTGFKLRYLMACEIQRSTN